MHIPLLNLSTKSVSGITSVGHCRCAEIVAISHKTCSISKIEVSICANHSQVSWEFHDHRSDLLPAQPARFPQNKEKKWLLILKRYWKLKFLLHQNICIHMTRCNLQKIMQLAMTTFSPVSMVNWITFNQQRHVLLPLKSTQAGKPLNDMC